jgi:poly(3-hydroxybutyrate) depolymerase
LAGQTITVGGQARTYVLSVPTAYTGTTPLALVFAWHGANVDGSLARNKIFNLESTSNGDAIFVYPDGTAAGAWDLSTGSPDFQLFPALLNAVSSGYCIDSTRVFSTGHSTGALMSNALGCYYGDLIRAIAPVEGGPPNTSGRAGCTGAVAAMLVHGANDPVFPIAQGQAERDFWLSQNGCGTQTATWSEEPLCVAYQGCQSNHPLVWCVHDEGHAWPTLGSDCNGGRCFEAGPAIWAFFSGFH